MSCESPCYEDYEFSEQLVIRVVLLCIQLSTTGADQVFGRCGARLDDALEWLGVPEQGKQEYKKYGKLGAYEMTP